MATILRYLKALVLVLASTGIGLGVFAYVFWVGSLAEEIGTAWSVAILFVPFVAIAWLVVARAMLPPDKAEGE